MKQKGRFMPLIIAVFMTFGVIRVAEVRIQATETPYIAILEKAFTCKVTSAAGSGSTVASVEFGQPMSVTATTSNGYLQVSMYKGATKKTGYIKASKVAAYVFDADFEDDIASFPESYKQKLRYVHSSYPKWTFTAYNTGRSFSSVVSTYQKTALTDVNDSAMYADSAVLEGTSWRRASTAAVQYYLDPRSYLTAYRALAFNSYKRNSAETLADAKSALSGTKLADYASVFYDASTTYNISMFNLMTRAIQEVGNGTGLGYTGGTATDDTSGTVYYNIFNIGANTCAEDGIDYAATQGWTTIKASILGGAKYLANKYVNSATYNQYTLYYQRFDIRSTKTLGTHIYMTNIAAALSESRRVSCYYCNTTNHIDEKAQSLEVPVYTGMPASTSYPAATSTDGYNLTATNPVTSYTDIADTSVSVTATKTSGKYSTPKITIKNGSTTLTENIDYGVGYTTNSSGKSVVTIYGLNGFSGSLSRTLPYTIGAEAETETTITTANPSGGVKDDAASTEPSYGESATTASAYTVTYKGYNGKTITTKTYKTGTSYTQLSWSKSKYSDYGRKGYKFNGWSVKKSGINYVLTATFKKMTTGKAKKLTNKAGSKKFTSTSQLYTLSDGSRRGFQFRYSTKKSMANATTKITGLAKNTYTKSGLKKGKTYYVQVRYYYMDSSNNRVYGAWSAVKKVTVK